MNALGLIARIIIGVVALASLNACQMLYDGQVNKAVEDCNKYISGQDAMNCRSKVRANAEQTPIGTKKDTTRN